MELYVIEQPVGQIYVLYFLSVERTSFSTIVRWGVAIFRKTAQK